MVIRREFEASGSSHALQAFCYPMLSPMGKRSYSIRNLRDPV